MIEEALAQSNGASVEPGTSCKCEFLGMVGGGVSNLCGQVCDDVCSQSGKAHREKLSWLRSYRYSPRDAELTSTQRLVIQFVACGLSDKEVAYFLGITCATVKAHNAAILKALGFHRRAQLVRFVFERKWFDPEEAQRTLEARRTPRRARRVS